MPNPKKPKRTTSSEGVYAEGELDFMYKNNESVIVTSKANPTKKPSALLEGAESDSVRDVLNWVGADREKAAKALEVEQGRERSRTSLINYLQSILKES